MKNIFDDFEDFEAACAKELEYARENDYVWYFDMLMEKAQMEEDPEAYIIKLYEEHWDKVKAAIQKDYYHTLADGVIAKPSPNCMMSLRDSISLFYGNTIDDIDMALNNAGRYDDRISFAKDVLDTFDLRDGDGGPGLNFMNFSLAIGEALSDAGRVEESDAYYEGLLSQYPDNGYMIANYVLTLKYRGEIERSKELLEKHISLDMEPVEENEMLFERAWELYEAEGNKELAKKYKDLQKKIYTSPRRIGMENAQMIPAWMFDEDQTVVRTEKKIYPNDPCPCGSGRKYKKCCGKN